MLDELQAETPEYERDPLNYLLSVGQSLEEIEQYRKDGIPLIIFAHVALLYYLLFVLQVFGEL